MFMSGNSKVVQVEIFNQTYPIRAKVESEEYIHKIAKYVDSRMREIQEAMNPSTTLGVAILAALNIADDLFAALDENKQNYRVFESKLKKYSHALEEGLKDSA